MQPARSGISVVIPIYNQAPFIAKALESVWAQQPPPDEIIVVDDGSTDATPQTLDALAARGPFQLIRQPNRGRSAARNRAIQASRGEWITFLDADDYWLPGKLDAQSQALAASGSDVSFAGSFVFGAGKPDRLARLKPSDCLAYDLVWGNKFALPGVMVKRSLLDRSGLFDEGLPRGQDWELWLRLAVLGPVNYLPDPWVAVRRHPLGRERYSPKEREADIVRVLSRFFPFIRTQPRFAFIARLEHQIWSWHYSVLAKHTFLEHRFFWCSYLIAECLRHHPSGLRFLTPGSVPPKLT